MKVNNPILPGFHPDPCALRVGRDWYVATSTFEWFPGVEIHHSVDLVHWELVARPLADEAMLDMAGFIRFTVRGKPGDIAELACFEVLDAEGNVYNTNLRQARQTVRYTLRGGEAETFQPNFTFQGFRYAHIVVWPGQPRKEDFTACVVHSDMRPIGEFACSEPMLNQLWHNILWGMLAVSEDKEASLLMGVNVNHTITLTFAIGSGLAAVASLMYIAQYNQVTNMMGSMLGLKAFVAAVLGGIGIIPGAMLGGLVIGIVESLSKAYISTVTGGVITSAFSDAIVFSILIIVLLVKPTGILGKNTGEKV